MKNNKMNILSLHTGTWKRVLCLCAAAVLLMSGCKEEVDKSARYVFKNSTVMQYLRNHEQYSEFVSLLEKIPVSRMSETTLSQLLSARGHFTVFAPTNDAIQAFLDTLCSQGLISEPSWEGFPDDHTLDSIEKVIAYNGIIDGGDEITYFTDAFPIRQDAEIPMENMYDRRLVIHHPSGNDNDEPYLVNDQPIDLRNYDIPVINGAIHMMNGVIAPSNNTLGGLIGLILHEEREGYLVMARLLDAIGLKDSLSQYIDFAYEDFRERGIIKEELDGFYTPEHRYYGFTLFAETDSLWEAELGKPANEISVEDVVEYLERKDIYPDAKRGSDYENKDNLLNRFVTYHLLPERLSTDHLVMHANENGYSQSTKTLGVAMAEFYVTMGQRRLLKIYESRESKGIYLNRFPILDNGRRGNYHEKGCLPENEGIFVGAPNMAGDNNIRNGIIYPINKLLLYDEATRSNLQKNRIRWAVSAMFPEFINNDIRMSSLSGQDHTDIWIPSSNIYPYLDGVDISEETKFFYWTGMYKNWENYLKDEFTIRGLPDVTFTLPPVPKRGTYEFRYQVQSGGGLRGIVQFYWGTDKNHLSVMGIPLDLRIVGNRILIDSGDKPHDYGWEEDTEDDDYNAEVDKRIRNNGYIKTPQIYGMRNSSISTRRILFRQTMDPDETYYIRFKTVIDDPTRYFYIDFFEYCAKEVYDNPEEPEDIW